MSNFNPADWAIGVLRPSNQYVGDFGSVDIATANQTTLQRLSSGLQAVGSCMMIDGKHREYRVAWFNGPYGPANHLYAGHPAQGLYTREVIDQLYVVLEDRLAAKPRPPFAIDIERHDFDVGRAADFIEQNPACYVYADEDADRIVLVCPDAETASLARLSL